MMMVKNRLERVEWLLLNGGKQKVLMKKRMRRDAARESTVCGLRVERKGVDRNEAE